MNLNPFAKKLDLSNPYDLYPLVYVLRIQPKLFIGKKEIIKELSKLLGSKFEHRVTEVPLIFNNTPPYNTVEEAIKLIAESARDWGRISIISVIVVGEQFKKLLESPKEFSTIYVEIHKYFDMGDLWYPLYCNTLNGYYKAARMQNETKAPVKGLPLKCSQCDYTFVDDRNNDEETEIDSTGCCENCGSFQIKLGDELLSKAYVYVRESEKKLGVTIFPTDY